MRRNRGKIILLMISVPSSDRPTIDPKTKQIFRIKLQFLKANLAEAQHQDCLMAVLMMKQFEVEA